MMNLKIEAVKALSFITLGAFLFANYSPKPEQKLSSGVEQNQLQMQDCKVVIKKVTNPDGSVDEVTEFLSINSQKQEQKIPPQKQKTGSISIGASSNLKGTIDLQLNKHSFQVLSDGNKDHVLIYKFKVLEF